LNGIYTAINKNAGVLADLSAAVTRLASDVARMDSRIGDVELQHDRFTQVLNRIPLDLVETLQGLTSNNYQHEHELEVLRANLEGLRIYYTPLLKRLPLLLLLLLLPQRYLPDQITRLCISFRLYYLQQRITTTSDQPTTTDHELKTDAAAIIATAAKWKGPANVMLMSMQESTISTEASVTAQATQPENPISDLANDIPAEGPTTAGFDAMQDILGQILNRLPDHLAARVQQLADNDARQQEEIRVLQTQVISLRTRLDTQAPESEPTPTPSHGPITATTGALSTATDVSPPENHANTLATLPEDTDAESPSRSEPTAPNITEIGTSPPVPAASTNVPEGIGESATDNPASQSFTTQAAPLQPATPPQAATEPATDAAGLMTDAAAFIAAVPEKDV
ncbi:MAG: hypothetical protein Q9218_006957, partial [Villophora microphyllina]